MPTTLDVIANIAQAQRNRADQRVADRRYKRAQDIISAARNIAAAIVGLSDTEDLLENELCALREERREAAMIRKLKSGT